MLQVEWLPMNFILKKSIEKITYKLARQTWGSNPSIDLNFEVCMSSPQTMGYLVLCHVGLLPEPVKKNNK
jgi:hypothetical protein